MRGRYDQGLRFGEHRVNDEAVKAIEKLGNDGWIVSVCYGPCGDRGPMWSVNVLHVDTDAEFANPIGSMNFAFIKTILDIEVPKLLEDS